MPKRQFNLRLDLRIIEALTRMADETGMSANRVASLILAKRLGIKLDIIPKPAPSPASEPEAENA